MGIILQLARTAAGGLAAIGFAKGLDLSLNHDGDPVTAYVAVYAGAAFFALLFVVLWVVIERRKRGTDIGEQPAGRTGYRGRPGSTATFRRTKFGETLDHDIDNEGDIDVEDSDLQ